MDELAGKTVLISGASGGLGEAVTRAFLAAGCRVAGAARSWKPDRVLAGDFLPLAADLTATEGCESVVGAVLERWKRLDAAIHLMGGFAAGGPLQTTSEAVWDRMMSLNAKAAFLFFKAALPTMLEAGNGRLIAIGARAGAQPPAGLAAYAASKAALHAIVEALAAELISSGVTANAVLPSTIDTPANRAAMPDADHARWVPAESLASLLLYLASPAAAHVNGALIPVYGRS